MEVKVDGKKTRKSRKENGIWIISGRNKCKRSMRYKIEK